MTTPTPKLQVPLWILQLLTESRKAFTAGVAGAVTAVGPVVLLDSSVKTDVTAGIVGFLGAALAVFSVTNAPVGTAALKRAVRSTSGSGTIIVPVTATLTVDPVQQPAESLTVEERLRLIPAAVGRKLTGLLAEYRDARDLLALDYVATSTVTPRTLNLAKGLTPAPTILLNDRLGCCFWAAVLHGIAVAYHAAGIPVPALFAPTDANVLIGYETTGYNPAAKPDSQGNNPTDQGTAPHPGLKSAVKLGWIKGFASIPTDYESLKTGIAAYRGAVVLCWGLGANVPMNGVWRTPETPIVDGHATEPYGWTVTYLDNDTWAEKGKVYPPFVGANLQAAYGLVLNDEVQPDLDHEAHAADVAAIRAAA